MRNVPYVSNKNSSCRNEVPMDLVIHHGTVRKRDREGLVPSQCFLDNSGNIHERVEVAEKRQAVTTNDVIELGLSSLENFGVKREPDEGRLKG